MQLLGEVFWEAGCRDIRRLHETMDSKYAFELKTPWSDGARVIFFSGEELVARLAALVPLVPRSGLKCMERRERRHKP